MHRIVNLFADTTSESGNLSIPIIYKHKHMYVYI